MNLIAGCCLSLCAFLCVCARAQRTLDASEELANLGMRYGGRGNNSGASFDGNVSLKYEPPTVEDDDGQKVLAP